MKSPGEKEQSTLGFAMRLGMELAVTTLVGTLVGYWLDTVFETDPWLMAIGLFLGGIAGFRDLYRSVKTDLNGE